MAFDPVLTASSSHLLRVELHVPLWAMEVDQSVSSTTGTKFVLKFYSRPIEILTDD